jgi:hypothetical protein
MGKLSAVKKLAQLAGKKGLSGLHYEIAQEADAARSVLGGGLEKFLKAASKASRATNRQNAVGRLKTVERKARSEMGIPREASMNSARIAYRDMAGRTSRQSVPPAAMNKVLSELRRLKRTLPDSYRKAKDYVQSKGATKRAGNAPGKESLYILARRSSLGSGTRSVVANATNLKNIMRDLAKDNLLPTILGGVTASQLARKKGN